MDFISNIILGIALSVDASSVAVANTFTYQFKKKDLILTATLFGLLQGVLPVIGYFIGYKCESWIKNYSPIIAFIVLCYFGGKMILDHFKVEEAVEVCDKKRIPYRVLMIQGVVTSIDALLIGVSFIGLGYNIWIVSSIIAITTFIVVLIVSSLGSKYKKLFSKHAKLVGGIVLILIGLKILLDAFII